MCGIIKTVKEEEEIKNEEIQFITDHEKSLGTG